MQVPAFNVEAQCQQFALKPMACSNIIMEKCVVTQIKSSKTNSKHNAQATKSMVGMPDANYANARRPRKIKVEESQDNGSADARTDEDTLHGSHTAAGKPLLSHLLERGKDLVSGDATSVVTVAAIVVGTALIGVELVPGLIMGASAVLLGKLFPEISAKVRPAIKGALGFSFSMTNKARQVMAETREQVHYLIAEVKHEQGHPKPAKKAHATAESASNAQSAH
jgi:hypothetical protein